MSAFSKLESLENPDRPPITLYREDSKTRLGKLKRGLSVEDQKIVERLAGLRQSDSANTRRLSGNPEEEVAMRLALLKGEDPTKPSTNNFTVSKAAETDSELLTRLSEQVNLDKKHNESMVSDIEERLARLRQSSSDFQSSSSGTISNKIVDVDSQINMDDMSEEDQVKRLIEQFTREVELETESGATEGNTGNTETSNQDEPMHLSSEEDEDVDVDSLCRICDDKRATMKCTECDDDIFCKKCFVEFHKELGEVHKPTTV